MLKFGRFLGVPPLPRVDQSEVLVRFNDFELDVRTGELRKNEKVASRLS